ncbi:glycoside hydrolase family 78 protein [Schaedlerella arabinosiphila]|uniref:glycoside hydrolase family 78 protein n=1 Tax=Schaedlerella arabinosiphila TaxID=2044587 RepID=UPI003FA7EDDC
MRGRRSKSRQREMAYNSNLKEEHTMRNINGLTVKNLTVEHMTNPIGLDVSEPRFGWKLESGKKNVHQTAYQIRLYKENELAADTGKLDRDTSIEVTAEGFQAEPKTVCQVEVTVWDNHGETASLEGCFETGRLGAPFVSGWAEPEQEPTPDSLAGKEMDCDSVSVNAFADQERDFAEFRPAQYVRIPFEVKKGLNLLK